MRQRRPQPQDVPSGKGGSVKLCAICVAEVDRTVMRPLGKHDALVPVCIECDEGPITNSGPSSRGYESTGGLLSLPAAEAGARRAMGDAEYERLSRLEEKLGRSPSPAVGADEFAYRDHMVETRRRFRTGANALKEPRGVRMIKRGEQ
jgi:hypothetical protein